MLKIGIRAETEPGVILNFKLHQLVFQSTASSFVFGTAALLTKPGQTFAPLIGTFLLTKLANHNFKEVSDFATDKTVSIVFSLRNR